MFKDTKKFEKISKKFQKKFQQKFQKISKKLKILLLLFISITYKYIFWWKYFFTIKFSHKKSQYSKD